MPRETSWPAAWSGATVTGSFVDGSGSPLVGSVVFKPTRMERASRLPEGTVVPDAKYTAILDSTGSFSITLPATDDRDVFPVPFRYVVHEVFPGGRTYEVKVPKDTTFDIRTVAPSVGDVAGKIVRWDEDLRGLVTEGKLSGYLRGQARTSAEWTELNPVLGGGVLGISTDTGVQKVGDGTTAWSALPDKLAGVYASVNSEALNLKQYGALGNGVADDTSAVVGWLNALRASGRRGYAPAGTYMVTPDTVTGALIGVQISGDSDRTTVFKARSAGTRIFDLRQSFAATIQNIAFDGAGLAQVGLDIGNSAGGASSGISLTRVRILNHLDKGIDATNCGDTVMTQVNGGPWPDSATGIYWPNSGGNNLLRDPKFFPVSAALGSQGPVRASVEASFQNMEITGGALMGIKCIDGLVSQTLRISGTQLYPIKNGGNIIGPSVNPGLMALEISGASKLAAHNSTQCFFDGYFQIGISVTASTFNSGATDGVPNAFGAGFVASNAGAKLKLSVASCLLRAETGANVASWNLPTVNTKVVYSNFFKTSSTDDFTGLMQIGDGSTGSGLSVGGGVTIKKVISATGTPWTAPTDIASGSFAYGNITVPGVTSGNGIFFGCSEIFPPGVSAAASYSSSGAVRVTVTNNSGATYTIPAGVTFRIYCFQI